LPGSREAPSREPPASAARLRRRSVKQLEDELRLTRRSLQATLHELECDNDRLRAENEELRSTCEGLRSTNEELQTVNEALYVANLEHQERVVELEHLDVDLENVLHVVDAGVLFLDAELTIRRFNAAVTRILPLRREDRGRPLSEIAIQAEYPSFAADVRHVLVTGERRLVTVRGHDGAWWSIGTRMFMGPHGVGGLIVMMHDISELERASGDAVPR